MNIEKKALNWLTHQVNFSKKSINLSILLGGVQGGLLVIQAYFTAQILQTIIIEKNTEPFVFDLSAVAILIVLRAINYSVRERVSFKAGQQVRQTIRKSLLDKLQQLGPIFAKSKPAGHWNAMMLEQVEQVQDFYSRYLPQRTLIAFIPLIILIVVFPQSWVAGLILLVTAPLIPLFMILVGQGAAKAGREHTVALQQLSSYFADRLAGLST
ncbi:MAG: cysteine/glutathione ABC transporter permease/ATP-binding protein CydD, partial [Shewanella sp.]|nr:cysteine/glutathione ABC transporter permease/ATP-binding protein CydD [Shewanella sp.]